MTPRALLAHFFIRFGRFIQSLALMVMKPIDLVEFSRLDYSTPQELDYWSSEKLLAGGLTPLESACLEKISLKQGRLLLLGLGGGREAIPLARQGFEVTGVDYVAEMVQRAKENAARCGVTVEGLVQDIAEFSPPEDSYDLVWLSNRMYSCIPTRNARVALLRRLHSTLKAGGCFFCSFHAEKNRKPSNLPELFRKLFALITLGNLTYEPGDILWLNREFLHNFSEEKALRSEFADGGFEVLFLQIPEQGYEGVAVLLPKGRGKFPSS